ncbi:oxidoreductase [Rhodobacter sp. TJ_12]|uniref:proton-conducting transporter transmembrane domain-containing protein n=1 Tax=Rhodobacter sp. TJ_12 TaxID=2029399 RepID=UPI001CBDC814|nr:proton-conducting transporter membrane subunit [Rhodobacter sp. TJ_12]MBZ4021528.1 oxidoreductase [Rhodobacter sp. TJ_12]
MISIPLLGWLGLALLLTGEIVALWQMRHLYRMLLASTLAEIGYAMLAFGIGTAAGDAGAILHLVFQAVMRLLVLLAARQLVQAAGSDRLEDLRGSRARAPFAALMFGFGMFSAMGLSPFKGALSKFVILYSAIEAGDWPLALGGTVASILAILYFTRAIQVVCFTAAPGALPADEPIRFWPKALRDLPIFLLALVTIALSLFPEPFLHFATHLAGLGPHALPEFEGAWSAAVLLPYIGGFAIYLIGRRAAGLRDIAAVILALATFALVAVRLQPGDLGDFFALIFAGIGLAVTLYSVRYIAHSHAIGRYWFFLFLMIGSMIGVATAEHLGNFYVFWELMTWTSYLLVIHEETDKALKAGAKYFFLCTGGAYVMHFGILLLHAELGTFDLAEIAVRVPMLSPGVAAVVLCTFLVGLGAKAGLFPLHSWLPDAHPVAPSAISAPMSGILTKAGLLGLIKILFAVFGTTALAGYGHVFGLTGPGAVLVALGGITFLIGEIQAFRQTDLKRLLAYSTLAQVGEITMVIGVGTSLALTGALMHVGNHALMKTLLFLAAGAFILRRGEQSLSALAGIGRVMPVTAVTLGLGLLAIMGVPPFGGFVGKFVMIQAAVDAGQPGIAAVILAGGVIAAAYYARILRVVFFAPYEGPPVTEAPLSMRLVLVVLAALVTMNGLWPQGLLALVTPVVATLSGPSGLAPLVLPPVVMGWSLAAAIACLGALAVYAVGRAAPRYAGHAAVAVMALALAAILLQAERYDLLSFWFAILIVTVGAANLLYSVGYMAHGHAQPRFFLFFVMMIGGLLGVTASDNLFSFFAFWEIMSSWTLYLVIIHEETRSALREGTKYFLFNFAGASLMFLGVTMLASGAGSFDFAALAPAFAHPSGWMIAAAALTLAGLLMKAAQLPARIDWQMHPAPAPTPVSGYISAVLLKVGPYGVLKLFAALGGAAAFARMAEASWMPNLMTLTALIAAITLLYAGAMAVIETGVKRILIWSTVSQLGYVLLGLSIGTSLGVAGGLLHAVNHMLVKDVLFLVAGCILAQAHVESLNDLGGLGRRMPITFTLFLIAGLSVAGIPPLGGFGSKWLIYQAAFQSGHYLLGLAALMSSLFTLAAVLKFAHAAFMGQLSPAAAAMTEPPLVMRLPMMALLGASLITGALPGLILVPIAKVQTALGLEAVSASWLGGLPGPLGWHPLALSLCLGVTTLAAWGWMQLARGGRAPSHIHACGVTTIPDAALHVPAAALYETPDRLLRRALHARPAQESTHHD